MKNKVSFILKSLVILTSCLSIQALYSVEREETKNQTVVENGISKRLLEGPNPNPTFKRILYLGVFHEFIFGPSRSQYKPSSIGVLAGFQHTLSSFMRGSLELRFSHWQDKEVDNNPKYIIPVGLYSKVALQPKIAFLSGTISPYVSAGLGYMIPFYGDKYFTMNLPRSLGLLMFIGGGGVEWMMIKSFGLNFAFDTWLDLEAKDYFAGDLSLSLVTHF